MIGAVTEVASSAIQGKPIDWDDVAAAAIGGAVQGALAGAGGPAWAVAGGALGSISENVSGALLKDQRIDPVVLAAGAAFGAYSGKLGSTLGKSSKAAQRAASNQWTKQGLKAAVQTEIGVFNKKGFSEVAGGVGKKFVSDYVRGTGVNVIRDDLRPRLERTRRGDLSPVSSKDGSGPSGRTGSIIQGATALPTVHIGNGGEYLHYQRYLDALSAADRPFPDTANRLSSF